MVKIHSVTKHSRAYKKKIKEGDILLSINGEEITDVLDYRFYLANTEVELLLSREGKTRRVKIKKEEYDDIGLEFETPLMDKKQTCKNKCIFCFIDQNPKGMRETIYFKDDDSRLSFLHGNYVTLTNMTKKDIERIIKMRISPVNISVHTTNPELRVSMMKNKRAGEVLSYMNDLFDAGISMRGQIVLCKGYNDKEELIRTVKDLSRLYPLMDSVSVVPAGITAYREGLAPLVDFTPEEAREVISAVTLFGDEMKNKNGSRMFYLADEFYLKAGLPIPEEDYYEDYLQIENGVGMLRSFIEEFKCSERDIPDLANTVEKEVTVSVATGVASYGMISDIADKIMAVCPKMKINVYKIYNDFFGRSITVSGLLTGRDIYLQLKDKPLGDRLLIPKNALRYGEDVFLCGMPLSELSDKLGVSVAVSENDGYAFLEALFGIL